MNSSESSLLPRLMLGVAAGAAVTLGASSASAASVVTDPTDITIGQGGSATGAIYFDPQTGYTGTTQAEGTSGINADFELSYFISGNGGNSPAKPTLFTEGGTGTQNGQSFEDANGNAPRFGISTGLNSATGTLSGAGNNAVVSLHNTGAGPYNWNAGQGGGFLGLGFTANAATGNGLIAGTQLYGWAEVSYNADQSLTLYRFGYDNTGNTSTTPSALAPGNSAVPEPGSLAAVATLGAAGLLAYRRRRAQEQPSAQA